MKSKQSGGGWYDKYKLESSQKDLDDIRARQKYQKEKFMEAYEDKDSESFLKRFSSSAKRAYREEKFRSLKNSKTKALEKNLSIRKDIARKKMKQIVKIFNKLVYSLKKINYTFSDLCKIYNLPLCNLLELSFENGISEQDTNDLDLIDEMYETFMNHGKFNNMTDITDFAKEISTPRTIQILKKNSDKIGGKRKTKRNKTKRRKTRKNKTKRNKTKRSR